MRKARLQLDLNFPGRIKNRFRATRYEQCVECISIKAVLMALVKKSQLETAQTVAYWYKWRMDAFSLLTIIGQDIEVTQDRYVLAWF